MNRRQQGCLVLGAVVGVAALGLFAVLVISGLLIRTGSVTQADPCPAYDLAVVARQEAIDRNQRQEELVASGWLTEEEFEAAREEVPPEPVEPEGGCP